MGPGNDRRGDRLVLSKPGVGTHGVCGFPLGLEGGALLTQGALVRLPRLAQIRDFRLEIRLALLGRGELALAAVERVFKGWTRRTS